MPNLKVVDPTAPRVTVERHQMADRPTTVNGMVVGFREFWAKFDVFTRAFEELVSAKYDVLVRLRCVAVAMTCVVSGLLTPAATRTGYRDGRASGGRDTAAGRRRSRHVAPAPDGQDTRRFDLDAGRQGRDPDSECPADDGPVVSRVHGGRRLSGQAVGSRRRRVARGRHRGWLPDRLRDRHEHVQRRHLGGHRGTERVAGDHRRRHPPAPRHPASEWRNE